MLRIGFACWMSKVLIGRDQSRSFIWLCIFTDSRDRERANTTGEGGGRWSKTKTLCALAGSAGDRGCHCGQLDRI